MNYFASNGSHWKSTTLDPLRTTKGMAPSGSLPGLERSKIAIFPLPSNGTATFSELADVKKLEIIIQKKK